MWPDEVEDKFLTTNLLGEREMKLMKMLKRFVKDERGIETSEYAIMLVLIAIALIVAIGYLRSAIANAFNDTASIIDTEREAAQQ
jgi:Flp pilus assembly pilin Flp